MGMWKWGLWDTACRTRGREWEMQGVGMGIRDMGIWDKAVGMGVWEWGIQSTG